MGNDELSIRWNMASLLCTKIWMDLFIADTNVIVYVEMVLSMRNSGYVGVVEYEEGKRKLFLLDCDMRYSFAFWPKFCRFCYSQDDLDWPSFMHSNMWCKSMLMVHGGVVVKGSMLRDQSSPCP